METKAILASKALTLTLSTRTPTEIVCAAYGRDVVTPKGDPCNYVEGKATFLAHHGLAAWLPQLDTSSLIRLAAFIEAHADQGA